MDTIEIIPVIHVLTLKQAMESATVCYECGIRKVFIICHVNHNPGFLVAAAAQIKGQYTDMWVGINFLGEDVKTLLQTDSLNEYADALWADDGLTELSEIELNELKGLCKFKRMFFGGLAFKYQAQPENIEDACKKSALITSVSTTSGSATGSAPTLTKIQNLRKYLGAHPMAIASGVSAYNIKSYRGLAQYVLVASSITDPFTEIINKKRLQELIQKNNELVI